jgi:hypothetical protein
MKRLLGATVIASALFAVPAISQDAAKMSFFVTSAGPGDGANLGGLAGADKHCQTLAAAAGSKKTWHAYLSTSGAGAVNAKDRIGKGPWINVKGDKIAASVAELHSDKNNLTKQTQLTEKGATVPGVGDQGITHDILTGSNLDGTAIADGDKTCKNWTSNGEGAAQVGHHDRQGGGANPSSWNSAHATPGCGADSLKKVGGAGLYYCFAVD